VAVRPKVARTKTRSAGPWAPDVRAFVRGSVPLFLSLGLLNASNYVFHIFASRLLGPAAYGALAALLAFVLVVSVPCGVLQTVVAKHFAGLDTADEDGYRSLTVGVTRGVTVVAVLGAGALLAAAPLVAAFLRVGVPTALLLGPYVLFALVASVPLGVLQGRMRFGRLGGAQATGVVVRFVTGLGLILLGLGVAGALLATVLAQGAMLLVALHLNQLPRGIWRSISPTREALRGHVVPTLVALSSFWLLVETDIVLARHFLPAASAGVYSSVGVLSRAILFLPAAISLVALPHFAQSRDRAGEARRWLTISLWLTGLLAIGTFGFMVVLRTQLLSVTFGLRFVAGASLLPILGLAMAALALTNVLIYFHVAMETRAHRMVLSAIVLEIVLVAGFHDSAREIAIVALCVSGSVAAALYHAARAAVRWRPPDGSQVRATGRGSNVDERMPELELSIVLPCRNAGVSLGRILERLNIVGEGAASEIIVVSDGSTDETVSVARADPSGSVRVLEYDEPVGKGQALRVGLNEARGRYVAFMDADGDIDPESMTPLLAIADLYEPDIVLGSKRHPLSDVRYPPMRRVFSWAYHKLTRVLFRVSVRDTQTGLKLIRRDVLEAVLPRMLEKRFAFDLELLVVARRLGYTGVFEAPVRIDYRFDSSVNPSAAFHILLDTTAIFYRRYVLDTYSPEPGASRRQAKTTAVDYLRILILNWRDIRNPDAGGAEVVTHEVAKRWVAQGQEVSLLTSQFPGGLPSEIVDGIRVRRFGRLRSGSFHLRVQWELAHLRGYDVVIDEINTVPFFTPLWRRRLPPVVGLIHQLASDVWDAEVPAPLAAIGRRLEPAMLRLYRNTPMITVSESTKRDLKALGLRDVRVVPQGRDEPASLPRVGKAAAPTFLFVGRLAANKRPDHAIEAFNLIRRELPDARLWIVGRGPMERLLRDRLPTGAEMLGFLPRQDLYRRMAAAHLLLVTSVREGWGLVITEANGVGTPTVSYNVPGVRDAIVDGRTGLLATAGDPLALARQAIALLDDAGRYSEMRQRAQEWALEFTWTRTAASVSSTLDEVLNSPKARINVPWQPIP
jgi:glycosyltransferase involved in cell wall biosynthesis/O-antigen/teichoic acid export membrane protein